MGWRAGCVLYSRAVAAEDREGSQHLLGVMGDGTWKQSMHTPAGKVIPSLCCVSRTAAIFRAAAMGQASLKREINHGMAVQEQTLVML